MLIKKSILQGKVKSLTNEGEKSITRSFMFKEKDKDYAAVSITQLFFSNTFDEDAVRVCGEKFLMKKVINIKIDTLHETLY